MKKITHSAIIKLHLQIVIKDKSTLPTRQQWMSWISHAYDRSEPTEVGIRIVTPAEMQTLNHRYRQKPAPTNVLAFDYNDMNTLGDIALCHDIIIKEATAQHKLLYDHYAHLTIHAMLHLLGYDHETKQDAISMENKEIQLLAALRIQNPYQIRSHSRE